MTSRPRLLRYRSGRRLAASAALAGAALLVVACSSGSSGGTTQAAAEPETSGNLATSKVILRNVVRVSLDHHSVTLPLHQGDFNGTKVWYILTEASDAGAADQLGLNFAPKLSNLTGAKGAVQDVTIDTAAKNPFGSGRIHFVGVPDFKPTRKLVPGPTTFPPAKAVPGAVGDARYSPFIRIKDTTIVYNAPIVAVGTGPFDVTRHTDTHDRVLAINKARHADPGQFYGASVEMLDINGFDSGKPIIYLSTEATDPGTAVLERATFVPALAKAPYLGGDDFIGSARERIFPFINGQTGRNNRQAQGLIHLIKDGHATEDASLANTGLINALRDNGDAVDTVKAYEP